MEQSQEQDLKNTAQWLQPVCGASASDDSGGLAAVGAPKQNVFDAIRVEVGVDGQSLTAGGDLRGDFRFAPARRGNDPGQDLERGLSDEFGAAA